MRPLDFIEPNKPGNTKSVDIIKNPMQMIRSFPMLAIPRWVEKESVPKPRMVVRVLKNSALAVLVSRMLPLAGGSVLKRYTK